MASTFDDGQWKWVLALQQQKYFMYNIYKTQYDKNYFQENYQVKYFLQDILRHGSWLMLNFNTYLCDELLFQSSQES